MQNADVIVVGCGGLGTVVAHDLAVAGAQVLGLDRHPPGHALGSSHGQTRVIRKAYFEHPDYVPLLLRSYQRWHELEAQSGDDLLTLCGVLEVGPKDGIVVPGVLRAAAEHQLVVESIDAHNLRSRFPQLGGIDDTMAGVFEPDGGYLMVERSVCAWAKQAGLAGAQFEFGVSVIGYSHEGTHWRVITDQGDRLCERLVLCPGPWAPRLLPASITSKLQVLRKSLFWYGAASSYDESGGFPVWLFERPEGIFYGFPTIDERGLKAAQHTGGLQVSDASNVDRTLHRTDKDRLYSFLNQHLPRVSAEHHLDHTVCMYTMTPDGHFLVGKLEGYQHLYIGAGLSGHGFKLVPALGEALAATVLDEQPMHRLNLFSANRFN
jgi:monomeric sarcosine oxidase